MTVDVLNEAVAKPGRIDEVRAFFTDVFSETRGFPGCRSVTLNVDGDGRTFILLGIWDSREAHKAAFAVPSRAPWRPPAS